MKILLIMLILFNYAISSNIDEVELKCFENATPIIQSVDDEELTDFGKGLKYYLLALFTSNSKYRDKAEKLLSNIKTSESKVLLGSIETLKARDFADNEVVRTLLSLTPIGFTRIYYVKGGISLLDEAIEENPNSYLIRFIRAMTYFSLPSPFMQYSKGEVDIEWIIDNIDKFPTQDKLKIDKSSAYWLIGKYDYEGGNMELAKDSFNRVLLDRQSPYNECANLIMQKLQNNVQE